jgi:hypothetical protein
MTTGEFAGGRTGGGGVDPLTLAIQLWPEEFVRAWDPVGSQLFLVELANVPLGTTVSVRITIRTTGISATVTGPIIGARRVGGTALVPGAFIALRGRAAAAAAYLDRVANSRPVDFSERDPRYAVAWRVALTSAKGRFRATTVNVSEQGCQVTWPGPTVSVGEAIRIRLQTILGPTLHASVCWSEGPGAHANLAGLHLTLSGRAARRWRSAVERAARSGAPLV